LPADPHAHGGAQRPDHGVTHGPAEPHDETGKDDHAHAQGHGPWHGPHESPAAMTYPLMALAVGAIVAGFVGIPAALGGGNAIEHFLEPSFTAQEVRTEAGASATRASTGGEPGAQRQATQREGEHEPAEEQASRGTELGLMGFSVLIAVAGILLARKFYVTDPDISERLAARWSGAHRTLL